jgi:MoaA/NifB/PqqE/SkfB family radical SAM enzyme
MGSFIEGSLRTIASSVIAKESPLYVQYYITARCNLRCEQCNVIYANSDQEECNTENSIKIIESLKNIGTSVLLLTGGEPFIRPDLNLLVKRCVELGIHPRIQTNGLATESALTEVVKAGARDISISLDSLNSSTQDKINGAFDDSWTRAIQTISLVSNIFPKNAFAAFGCVLSPSNLKDITKVIKFATKIGWWVSLVPAHSTPKHEARAFSTFDRSLDFSPDQYDEVKKVLDEVKFMKKNGYNVYDSDVYLDDILRFVTKKPTTWRDRNNGVCDSPNSYFAITPNGEMAVCCDWRTKNKYSVQDIGFPKRYKNKEMFPEIHEVAKNCSGCMYGSYPEITTSIRFFGAALERFKIFIAESRTELIPHTPNELIEIARKLVENE